MTEKRFKLSKPNGAYLIDGDKPYAHWINDDDKIVDLLNSLADKNEQLKKDRFICLDCEHSGYIEIGCLCEYNDHWQEHITECEDFKELRE